MCLSLLFLRRERDISEHHVLCAMCFCAICFAGFVCLFASLLEIDRFTRLGLLGLIYCICTGSLHFFFFFIFGLAGLLNKVKQICDMVGVVQFCTRTETYVSSVSVTLNLAPLVHP